MIGSVELLPPNADGEMIPARDIYFRDGSIRKEILVDGKWVELHTQPNASASVDFDWTGVVSVTKHEYMTHAEAKNLFGHLPNFPKL